MRACVAWLEDAAITVTMRAVPSPEEGLWVALKDDAHTVVGSGKTFVEARAEATEAGYAQPLVVRIPESVLPFIGQTRVCFLMSQSAMGCQHLLTYARLRIVGPACVRMAGPTP